MIIQVLRFVPKNIASNLLGWLAHRRFGSWVTQRLIYWFVNRYKVQVEEVAKPITEFSSLGEFFVRDLKVGARPLGEGLISPVDGVVSQFGEIRQCGERPGQEQHSELLQAKGMYYSVSQLLGDSQLGAVFNGGYYATIYLAPHNYHCIHSPVDGDIVEAILIPGTLWPVNRLSVESVPRLFCVNERVITVIRCAGAGVCGRVAVVKVGALNVGSISVSYDSLRSNRVKLLGGPRTVLHRDYQKDPIGIGRGDKIAQFELGSTVILLIERSLGFVPGNLLQSLPVGGDTISGEPPVVWMGQSLGALWR